MVSVPVRLPLSSLSATSNVTVPFPLPLAPLRTVIQETLLLAVHAHPAGAVTEVEPVLSFFDTVVLVGFTVNVLPATVKVPVRADPLLAATLNDRAPLPFPLAPEPIEIQAALLAAV